MPNPATRLHMILHATDFSPESERAFVHALKAAVDERSCLFIMHVGSDRDHDPHWDEFPHVRPTLERWGLLEANCDRQAVYEKLGIEVEKVAANGNDVSAAVVRFLERHAVDLVVVATHDRHGLPNWIRPSISEPIARRANIPVLVVPHNATRFVSADNGQVTLRRVLVPIDHEPDPSWGVEFAQTTLHAFGVKEAEVTLLHVGSPNDAPVIQMTNDPGWTWRHITRSGTPVDEILSAADSIDADLIVMTTAGHHGLWDTLRGSTTEQVLRRTHRPLLAVPCL